MIHMQTTRTGAQLRRLLSVASAAGLFAGLGVAPAMGAAASSSVTETGRPEPFTIHEVVDFGSPADPTFTTEGPICSSGTFHDDFTHTAAWHGAASKLTLMGSTVYTCADGSGTILATKKVFISFNPDGSFTDTGPVEVTGGTGAYAGIHGNGKNAGVAPVNPATSIVDQGTGTIIGQIVP